MIPTRWHLLLGANEVHALYVYTWYSVIILHSHHTSPKLTIIFLYKEPIPKTMRRVWITIIIYKQLFTNWLGTPLRWSYRYLRYRVQGVQGVHISMIWVNDIVHITWAGSCQKSYPWYEFNSLNSDHRNRSVRSL